MSKYHDQARVAILTLDDRHGSSLPALKKKLKLTADKYRFLNSALKKGVESGAFIKVKGAIRCAWRRTFLTTLSHERLSQRWCTWAVYTAVVCCNPVVTRANTENTDQMNVTSPFSTRQVQGVRGAQEEDGY
jgi:hypothetical protein